jgi:hypothetical protein
VNVLPKGTVFFDIPDPPIIAARLPDFTAKAQFLPSSERETAFDQLQGSLQCDGRCNQHMEAIGHQHKFVQQIFALPAVMQQNFNEELRHSFGLKQAPFLKCGSGDEVGAVSRVASVRSSPKAPQRLKPLWSWNFIAALEALRHPKANMFRRTSRFGTLFSC